MKNERFGFCMEQNLAEFEQIYRGYYRKVYSFIYKMCLDESLAETLTQEAFYRSYRRLSKYNGNYDLYVFISAVAYDLFLKYLKGGVMKTVKIDLYVSDPDAPLSDEPGYKLSKIVETTKLIDTLRKMSSTHGELFVLRVYGEVSYEELAAKYGISVNSIKSMYREAKIIFKENLIDG